MQQSRNLLSPYLVTIFENRPILHNFSIKNAGKSKISVFYILSTKQATNGLESLNSMI